MQKIFHIIVTGRVQMVMYRDFAQRKARVHDLVGTVQNLQNGSVELFVQGDEKELDAFIKKLHKGPVLARVEDVKVEELSEPQPFEGFKIIF